MGEVLIIVVIVSLPVIFLFWRSKLDKNSLVKKATRIGLITAAIYLALGLTYLPWIGHLIPSILRLILFPVSSVLPYFLPAIPDGWLTAYFFTWDGLVIGSLIAYIVMISVSSRNRQNPIAQ